MTTGGGDPLFVDTNILVYSSESRAPLHTIAVQTLETYYNTGTQLWISRQILREYLATLSRPQVWGNPQPMSRVIAEVQSYESRFRIAEDDANVTARLLFLLQQVPAAGKHVHDANIVATMQTYGIRRLLTHNEDDFARYAGLITIMPLSATR